MKKLDFQAKLRTIKVIWLDASKHGRNLNYDYTYEFPPGILSETCGYLLSETNEALHIAQNLNPEDDTCRDIMNIPKIYIKKRKYLK